jgi:single stranded DNA-binding protein
MRDKNQVDLRGRLGDTPKYLEAKEGNQSLATFSVCTNYVYVTKDGVEKTKSDWHDVVVWGKAADNAAKFLVKGQTVEVNGRLQRREYEDKEGNTRQKTEVVATQIEYGNKPKSVTASATEETPIATKRQQTLIRQKGAEDSQSTDGSDPF